MAEKVVDGGRVAIDEAIKTLLADPDVGRVDMRPKIIGGFEKLVADRVLSAGEAVARLSTFPKAPSYQRETSFEFRGASNIRLVSS